MIDIFTYIVLLRIIMYLHIIHIIHYYILLSMENNLFHDTKHNYRSIIIDEFHTSKIHVKSSSRQFYFKLF